VSTVQNRPVGLLDFLGIQSGGDVPQSLFSEILLNVDIKDLYLMGRTVNNTVQTTGHASSGIDWATISDPTHLVPQGYLRLLQHYSAYVYGITSQGVDIGMLWIGLPAGGGVYNTCGVKTGQLPAIDTTGSVLCLDRPVFVQADGYHGCSCRTWSPVAATTYSVQHVSRWVDLKI